MYLDRIKEAIASTPWADADPAIVECWMRLEHGTLDQLDRVRFRREAQVAAKLAVEHPDDSRTLAASYGLKVEAKAAGGAG